METIEISKQKLTTELVHALQYRIGTEWDIFVDIRGDVDCRHNTFSSEGWSEIIDLYDASLELDGTYPGDTGYNYIEAVDWIINELNGWLPDTVEFWVGDEQVEFSLELVD